MHKLSDAKRPKLSDKFMKLTDVQVRNAIRKLETQLEEMVTERAQFEADSFAVHSKGRRAQDKVGS